MHSGHNAARSRRAASSFLGRLWSSALLLVVGSVGLSWSGDVLAQSACPLTPVTTTPNVGLPGSTLNFSFSTGTGTFCGTTVGGDIIVQSGGATVAPPTFSTPSSTTVNFTVTLPATPGVAGVIDATCTTFNCGGAVSTASFNYSTSVPTLTITNGDGQSEFANTPFATPLEVVAENSGTPAAGLNLVWAVTAGTATIAPSGPTDTGGVASAIVTPTSQGPIQITATRSDFPGVVATFNLTSLNPREISIESGDGQTTVVGTQFPDTLMITAYENALPSVGLVINWTVTGGAATITPLGPVDTGGVAESHVTPTVAGPIQITATRSDDPSVFVVFNLTATPAPATLTRNGANPRSGTAGAPITFSVNLESAGAPFAGGTIEWTATPPFAPATGSSVTNAGGNATFDFSSPTVGSFANAVTATHDPDGVPATGDEISVSFDVDVNSAATLDIDAGDDQTSPVGTPYPIDLAVVAEDAGAPAAGITINWVVSAGSANITPNGPTNAAQGRATATVTPQAVGLIEVTASRADAPAATVTFTLSATPAGAGTYTLVAVSTNPLTGAVGSPVQATVRLEQAGVAVNGATVQWNAGPPFAPAATSSTTDAAGDASASFTPSSGGNFPNVFTAFFDPDGVPANGDEVSINLDAIISSVGGLVATSGGGQSAAPGAAFSLPLQVHADNGGVDAAGVTILWSVANGSASLSAPSSITDSAGDASVSVMAGESPGPVTIIATRQDIPAATAAFSLTVDGSLGSLSIIGGDDQVLAVGVPSAPMVLELKNASGAPIAGAVVTWNSSGGSLTSEGGTKATTETTTTGSDGRTSNTIVISEGGPVQVTASSPLAAAPAVFNHNGSLADMPGLDPDQLVVATAVDQLCPALAAIASPTTQQQDLLARCKELLIAAPIDPTATGLALDALMADVALTQANAAFNAAQSQFQNLKTRIAALRSGTGGTSFGGLALNTSTGPISLGMLANAFSNNEAPTAEIGTDFSRWGFFAAGTIGRGESDAGNSNPAFDYDLDGITVGVDYRKSDQWIFGGSFGYTRQDTQLPGERGGLDTSGWSVSAYSTFYQQDSWYMDGVVTWGRNDYELMRRIQYTLPLPGGGTSVIDQVADSDSSGDLLSTAFTFGRDFNRGAFGIGPYGRLLYTRLGFDEIREELLPGQPGSGLGLEIESRSLTSLASVIGTKFTYTYSTDWGVLMPHASLEWEHEFKDDPQSVEARFINDPTGSAMVIQGDPLDTDYFRLGLGMSMVLTRGRSGFFYYERLVGRNGISQWNLAVGLRMEF